LKNLIFSDEFTRKSLPYLKKEYFSDRNDQCLFEEIQKYVNSFNVLPTREALIIEIGNNSSLSEDQFKDISDKVDTYFSTREDTEVDWLLETSEKFCQDRAIYNAVLESISIIDNEKDSGKDKGVIPQILSDALAVCFDPNIGHDYIEDSDERFESYHTVEEKLPWDLDYFNKITKGGLSKKTLNVALAGTGVGKSLFMCHHAASCLSQGFNVLYITLEMAEEKIAERIDANLMNITIDDLHKIPKDLFEKKIKRVKANTKGKLIVKEYPPASANVNHFRNLLNELKLKRKFVPDIIFVDYLNIMSSSRLKYGNTVNSYNYIKSIAEEVRGLAVENNLPIVSATQTTRSGYTNTDLGLEDTSESFGLPATADFMFALISTEELEELDQILVKQLKNRYSDPGTNKRFVIGIDRAKMKLYDLEETAQTDLVERTKNKKKKSMPWNKKEEDDIPAFDQATDNRMTRKKDFSEFSFT
tara:strand:- start:4357 stop:5778 length:1422 start_codon:yes stop_codon:yes gene_type:complete